MSTGHMAKVVSLTQTCGACPSQWEGETEDGRKLYVRYRWGHISVGLGPLMSAAVDATILGSGDGRTLVLSEQIGDGFDGVLEENRLPELVPMLDWSEVIA